MNNVIRIFTQLCIEIQFACFFKADAKIYKIIDYYTIILR